MLPGRASVDITTGTITCKSCDQTWPWEYNYCPICGQGFKALKRFSQRSLAELTLDPRADRMPFMRAIFGFDYQGKPPSIEATRWALAQLRSSWAEVLKRRFGLDSAGTRTLKQIGLELGVHPTGIRQREVMALRRLRHPRIATVLQGKSAIPE